MYEEEIIQRLKDLNDKIQQSRERLNSLKGEDPAALLELLEILKTASENEVEMEGIRNEVLCQKRLNSETLYSDVIVENGDRNAFANAYMANDVEQCSTISWNCAKKAWLRDNEPHLEDLAKIIKTWLDGVGEADIIEFQTSESPSSSVSIGFNPMEIWFTENCGSRKFFGITYSDGSRDIYSLTPLSNAKLMKYGFEHDLQFGEAKIPSSPVMIGFHFESRDDVLQMLHTTFPKEG